MIHYRNIVSAFLEYEEKVLLMKRGFHKKIAPGQWSSITGHIEPGELNHPYEACYREIFEEANLNKEDIEELHLKYIAFNKLLGEIVVNNIFFGKAKTNNIKSNDEGELFWVPKNDVADKIRINGIAKLINLYYSCPSKEIVLVAVYNEEPFIRCHSLD